MMQKEEKVVVVLLVMAVLTLIIAFFGFSSQPAAYSKDSKLDEHVYVEGTVLSNKMTHTGDNLIIKLSNLDIMVFVPKNNGAKEVYDSFNNSRAILYRKIKNLGEIYPGVILQRMVCGNKDKNSGSGVMFTRNNFGEKIPTIEYGNERSGIDIVDNKVSLDEFDDVPNDLRIELQNIAIQLEEDFESFTHSFLLI